MFRIGRFAEELVGSKEDMAKESHADQEREDATASEQASRHLSRALKQAFPLPQSGAFNDLLAAISAAERG